MNSCNYGYIFHDIIIHDGLIAKIAKTTKGKEKINNEARFYQIISSLPLLLQFSTPRLVTYDEDAGRLVLEYIEKATMVTVGCLPEIHRQLACLHSIKQKTTYQQILDDTLYEVRDKPLERYDGNFDLSQVWTINGLKYKDIFYYVDKIQRRIRILLPLYYSDEYSLIHGDPHLGNIIQAKDQIYFIDPRGQYGQTKLYGLPHYDYAKLLFGLSGYSEFDQADITKLDIHNGNLNIDFLHERYYTGTEDMEGIEGIEGMDELTKLLSLSIWLANNNTFHENAKRTLSLLTAYYLCEKYL